MAVVRALGPDSLAAVIDIAMRRHEVTSGRALSRKARDLDLEISYTVLNELRRGTYLHPLRREQREILAQLSGVPLRVINELAGARDLAPFNLPERAADLTGDQRGAVLQVISAFVTANEALARAASSATELPEDASTFQPREEVRVVPRTYNDASQMGVALRAGRTVILDLSAIDDDGARRLIDFMAGVAVGLNGKIDRVSAREFIISRPAGVTDDTETVPDAATQFARAITEPSADGSTRQMALAARVTTTPKGNPAVDEAGQDAEGSQLEDGND